METLEIKKVIKKGKEFFCPTCRVKLALTEKGSENIKKHYGNFHNPSPTGRCGSCCGFFLL